VLGILVPSRGRPGNLRRLIDAIAATATGEVRIYTRVDDDDPTRDEYLALEGVHITTGPRIYYGPSLNQLAPIADRDGCDHLAMFGDDVVPETHGWDRLLIDALDGRLGVAYGSDGLEHKHARDLPTHYVTQTEISRRLGWFAPPTMRHLFLDNVARDLGKGLGNFVYVPEAKIRHLHPWAGLAERDQTYREGGSNKRVRQADELAYRRWARHQLPRDLARLLP
jgi:hypothetical protein